MALACAILAAGALLAILGYVVEQGVGAINWDFLTQLPHPVGIPGGGVANGIVGTFIILAIATAMAVPIGLLTGIYLALFGRGVIPEALRFLSDVLSGVPSIAIGLFAYAVLVAPLKHFSGISASFAFMMLMLPLLVRTSEQAIRSVPQAVREGALALGMSNFRATVRIVLPTARPAIITALLLAIARVTGETAPLLFTAFGSQYWETNPNNPMAALALQVFNYAISPYPNWQAQAWAGALLLVVAVFVLSLGARLMLRRAMRGLEA
jgi:phosphate transport system permease protein